MCVYEDYDNPPQNATYAIFPILIDCMALSTIPTSIKEIVSCWSSFSLGAKITLYVLWAVLIVVGTWALLTDIGFVSASF